MKFSQEFGEGSYVISSYDRGYVQVNEAVYRDSLILMPECLDASWAPARFEEVTAEDMQSVAELAPEIVLLGTGSHQRFPHPAVLRPLLERGIGVEVMDTAAACRTYNIIMAEGRQVAAALLMI